MVKIGNYIIIEKIGSGGYGVVVKALHVSTGVFVAIKQVNLRNSPDSAIRALQLEINLMQTLDSEYIVKYLDHFTKDDVLCIVMELVENGSLSNLVKRCDNELPETVVNIFVEKILYGLQYLHNQGVVHRDIKGANILLTRDGDVKLADFGISSKLSELQKKKNAEVVGTPYWMAPEVIRSEGVQTVSDIWSLGCTIIELLTGKPPYYNLNQMQAMYHMASDSNPPIPQGISSSLKDLLNQCFFKRSKFESISKATSPTPVDTNGNKRTKKLPR